MGNRMTRTPLLPGPKRKGEAGISLIELLIAGAVMVVGFMAVMMLILTAIASNNRNKMDSSSAMLAQAVVEQIKSTMIPGTTSLTDCAGATHTIDTAGATGGGAGASLSGADIDFSQATPPAGYHMDFAICNVANTSATYDVRWNVKTITAETYLITVAVRLKGAGSDLRYFALPVTLRTYVGSGA